MAGTNLSKQQEERQKKIARRMTKTIYMKNE